MKNFDIKQESLRGGENIVCCKRILEGGLFVMYILASLVFLITLIAFVVFW